MPIKIETSIRITIYMDNPHVRVGGAILGTIWYVVAKKIVDKAVELYHVTPEQAEALYSVFLRPGDYIVEYD
jgi:hypothetical protein